jgi:predicted dehydrogenase
MSPDSLLVDVPRVRLGLIGAGTIAQVAHLPALRLLARCFDLVALADPSTKVRERVGRAFDVPRLHADWRELLEADLDAVMVCTPHSSHAEITLAALDRALHVFVEKPLCITVADADAIVAAQRAAGRVVQVGYMKRFDPAYLALVAAVRDAGAVRFINTVTYDPGMIAEPYFPEGAVVRGDDLPVGVRERGAAALQDQLEAAFGSRDLDRLAVFSGLYLDALIHDTNLVLGVLDALALEPEPMFSTTWLSNRAATATWTLPDGAAWTSTFFWLPGMGRFEERLEVYFDDSVHRLIFDAPYLQEVGTRYERCSGASTAVVGAPGGRHRGAYVRELAHFYDCIVDGEVCRAPAEMGRRDVAFLTQIFRQVLRASS